MKIAIATKNPTKIKGIEKAFRKFFPECDLETLSFEVESGVGREPIGDDVFIGAITRLKNLKAMLEEMNMVADYYVSCESGLLPQYGIYFNDQVVLVEHKGQHNFGKSSAYSIPEKYVEEIITTELGEVFNKLFDGKGGVSILTNFQTSRLELIKASTIMALSGYNWPD